MIALLILILCRQINTALGLQRQDIPRVRARGVARLGARQIANVRARTVARVMVRTVAVVRVRTMANVRAMLEFDTFLCYGGPAPCRGDDCTALFVW